jgi:hypothetical protein
MRRTILDQTPPLKRVHLGPPEMPHNDALFTPQRKRKLKGINQSATVAGKLRERIVSVLGS